MPDRSKLVLGGNFGRCSERRGADRPRRADAAILGRDVMITNLRTRAQLLASAGILSAAVCTPAYAQATQASPQTTVSQATNASPQNQSVGDENSEAIVVTAQKREQILLDVP